MKDKALITGINLTNNGVNQTHIMGYKHGTVAILAATIGLPATSIKLTNIPLIKDTTIIAEIISRLGGNTVITNNQITIDTTLFSNHIIPETLSKNIHGALYLLPAILGRLHKVEIGKTGGCQIGASSEMQTKRPIKHMISVLEQFGASFRFEQNRLIGSTSGFSATDIDIMQYSDFKDCLTGPLVSGATKTAILAAMYCKLGTTHIFNPYPKPDVMELVRFLQKSGMNIHFTPKVITIKHASNYADKIEYQIMSDVSHIVTMVAFAAYHRVQAKLSNITTDRVQEALAYDIKLLSQMGINICFEGDQALVYPERSFNSQHISITSTNTYSDHQPFFAILLSMAKDSSTIIDHVWHNRYSYANELNKLGFDFAIKDNSLHINPTNTFRLGQTLHADDLRSSAALLIAASKLPGITTITGLSHLERGYDNLAQNIIDFGVRVTWV